MNILYLATADARGHLMRAQLLTHALREQGANVEVMTTSDRGAEFLTGFGIRAEVLSRHYAVVFDRQQNMLRRETDRNVAQYVFYPKHFLRDMWFLRRRFSQVDLVINDSFHPALLIMGSLPGWKKKVVHIFGSSLRHALEQNFSGRLPGWLANGFRRIIAWQISSARASITHDFSYQDLRSEGERSFYLPTPVALAKPLHQSSDERFAAVYLNPHFRDPDVASALESGIKKVGLSAHLVGEGVADRQGWLEQDERWVERAACSQVIVSAPGMAALSVALVYRKPILLLVTDQPEQQANARKAAELGLHHRTVVWRGNGASFSRELVDALSDLLSSDDECNDGDAIGYHEAERRLQNWTGLLKLLVNDSPTQA